MPKDKHKESQKGLQVSHTSIQKAPITAPKSAAELKAYAEQARGTILLVDRSYSMSEPIEPGKSRFDAVCDLRDRIDRYNYREFQFADTCEEAEGPPWPGGGGTHLSTALKRVYHEKPNRIILVSDGEPNGPGDTKQDLVKLVKSKGVRIDVFFIGHVSRGKSEGQRLLEAVAKASGGKHENVDLAGDGVAQLEQKIVGLLPKPGETS